MVEKSWPVKKVWKAHGRAVRKARAAGGSGADPTLPFFRWLALRSLDGLEQQFADGDGFALLLAIRVCANHDLPLPGWASRAYISRFDQVLNCRADSWDAVFGRPYRKGFHLGRARQRRALRFAVHSRIREIRDTDPNQPIDDGLFESVGEEFGIGKTLCNELYYQARRELDAERPARAKKPRKS